MLAVGVDLMTEPVLQREHISINELFVSSTVKTSARAISRRHLQVLTSPDLSGRMSCRLQAQRTADLRLISHKFSDLRQPQVNQPITAVIHMVRRASGSCKLCTQRPYVSWSDACRPTPRPTLVSMFTPHVTPIYIYMFHSS